MAKTETITIAENLLETKMVFRTTKIVQNINGQVGKQIYMVIFPFMDEDTFAHFYYIKPGKGGIGVTITGMLSDTVHYSELECKAEMDIISTRIRKAGVKVEFRYVDFEGGIHSATDIKQNKLILTDASQST